MPLDEGDLSARCSVTGNRELRSRDLLRTVEASELQALGPSVWAAPEELQSEGAADDPSSTPALQAAITSEAAGAVLMLSHVWDQPENWSDHFGEQSFVEAKHALATAALRRAALDGLAGQESIEEPNSARVWLDRFCLPTALAPDDHPSERLDIGEYQLPVRDLKALVAQGETVGRYTILHFQEPYTFEGTKKVHDTDEQGRLLSPPEVQEVQWTIAPGSYYARKCRVVAEGTITREAAAEREVFEVSGDGAEGGLRKWCPRLRLRDEVWAELTLGSLRAESMKLFAASLRLSGGLVALAPWNYFDHLWPLTEWALFCADRGPQCMEFATFGTGSSMVEYQRALRRLSVADASCRDDRDRGMLLEELEKTFCKCKPHDEKDYECARWNPPTGSMKELIVREGRQTAATPQVAVERVVDWAPLERYIRATAIALFVREASELEERKAWMRHAEEFEFTELRDALKGCIKQSVEEVWATDVVAVLEKELMLATGHAVARQHHQRPRKVVIAAP